MSATKQRNLITMNGQDGKPLSLDQILAALIALLRKLDSRNIAQTLSEISGVLYDKNEIEANEILTKKYASLIAYPTLLPTRNNDGCTTILFTQNAIWILNTLLTFNPLKVPEDPPEQIPIMCFPKNSLYLPSSFQDKYRLPIVELFLLTNQLISHLQNEIPEYTEAFSSKTQLYFSYSRIDEDAVAAIGKSEHLFNTDYFNKKLQEMLGMTVEQLSDYLFILFTLVRVHQPAKIEPDISFRRIIQEADRTEIAKLLSLLAINMRSVDATQSQIAGALRQDFLQDVVCRGKPFLKINQRYLCLRPDLLISALGNFPYFYLLNTLPEEQKDEFFKEFGLAFEKYITYISKRAVGERSHEYFYKKKRYGGSRSGDRHLAINDTSRAIIEIKSSRENDEVKGGSEKEIIDKFILLKGTEKKPKGVLQLIKDAKKFRDDQGFVGEIFTIIIFRGKFPATSDFDELVHKKITASNQYQEYLENVQNHPTIWLTSFTCELVFSAVAQGASLEEFLKRLALSPPSKMLSEIKKFMSEKSLNGSFAPLFLDDLMSIQERVKGMIAPDVA